ncbi:MAG: glutamate synthase central domain-containing protein, partial [Candidatus Sumerlaeota bacterium]
MNKPTIEGLPAPIGLYNPEFEHDACGIGFVANIGGERTHEIVELALKALVNLTHRGAIDIDARTGDGAGLLTQIPYKILRKDLKAWGVKLKDDSSLGVGMIFFPLEDELAREKCRLIIEESLRHYELEFYGWRKVPIDRSAIGDKADDTRPEIEQVLFGKPDSMSDAEFDDTIYLCRKVIEGSVLQRNIPGFYICSMSARTIVYKGMFVAPQLAVFFQDLKSPLFETALAVLHQRYSTNTFPQWRLAQPFRMICHNGEINTLAGNKNWTQARERQYSKDLILGARIRKIMPIIQPGGSDSAAFDNVLESVVHSERSIVHSLSMLMPPAWEHHDEMPQDQKDFFKYHSTLAEPWDGPAAIAFTDGRIVGATLDRNGLRPARYKITKGNQIIFASEVGVINLADDEVIEKGRLGPGKMIAVDTETGTVYRNDELKSKLAGREDYGMWLKKNLQEYPGDGSVATPAVLEAKSEDALSLVMRQKIYGYTHEDVRRVLFSMFKSGKEAIGSMGDDTPLAVLSSRAKPLHHFFKQRFAQVTNPPIDPIRESAVMSIFVNIGPRGSMYSESPEHARMLRMDSPVLTPKSFAWIVKHGERVDFRVGRIDATFEVSGGVKALEGAIAEICRRGEKLIADGATILIISDRNVSADRAPVPSLLAVGALHHHLIRAGRRLSASIIAESGETRDPHLFAALLGYGAAAIFPFVIYEEINAIYEKTPDLLDGLTGDQAT